LGCLSLTRENSLVLVAVVALWLAVERRRPGPDRLAWGTAFAVGLALVLLPVAARNAIVGGEFALTTAQFGPNLYIGNNERADGTYMALRSGRGAPEYEREDATELAERALGRSLTPREVSRYWTSRALAYIRSQPGDWLRLLARKFDLLWNATEVLDTESQATHADWSGILKLTSPIGHFGVLAPLALFGVWISWSQRQRLALLALMLAAYAASVLVFYVFARYRFPLVPFLVLFASAGVVEARRFFGERPARQRAACLTATAAAAIFCNWTLLSEDQMRAITEHNLGAALQEQGRHEDAIAHYHRALALSPDYAPSHSNLGALLRARGRLDEAIEQYRRALELEPAYPSAHYNLGNALLAQGRAADAADQFRRALAVDPQWIEARNNLGIALAEHGQLHEAVRSFRQVLELEPAAAEAHYNLGNVLVELGQADQAVTHFRQALAAKPDYFAAHYDLAGVFLQRGQVEDAIAHLRQAIEIDPKSAEAHNNLGIALASAGRLDEAIEQFKRSLEVKPDFEEARRNVAMALEASAQLGKATARERTRR
jgi:tetratricopeptide (TPR) repeat protein